jgi:hypothetical protein
VDESKEEWVVCRVFKKCQVIKMRPPQDSPTMGSPCHDAANASLGELGELDVSSILGGLASSGSPPGALHHQGSAGAESFGAYRPVDMSAYMSWMAAAANEGAAAAAAMLPWATTPPLGLFGNVFAPNNHQLLQKPLPFAGCSQPRELGGVVANVIGSGEHTMFGSSVVKVGMECDQQQQQQPEQQLGMDESTWRTF